MRIEKAYLEKIEWYKSNINVINQQWEIKCEHRVREAEHKKQIEIDRLTVIINLYKEKLIRKESETRNLLVELKVYKEKIEVITLEY